MPPPRQSVAPKRSRPQQQQNSSHWLNFKQFYAKYFNFKYLKFLIFDAASLPIVTIFILLAELLLNVFVINRVPYTEIDWIAYMQECEGFLNGTTNYSLLKGDTGPLVYPAAFVYIYSALYFITSQGQNIRLAQYIFLFIYLLQLWLVLRLYSKSRKVPPYVLALSAFTSYRVHSLYVLRLFNDPVAVLFLYAALNLFMDRKWSWGSICFSLGVGVKMNILLFAPALLLFYISNLGYLKTLLQLIICGGLQLLLGAPFLLTYPWEYVKGSFDLGRIFEHKWTVNYRFLSREMFENKYFHVGLLGVHLGLLFIFAHPAYKFFQNYARLRALQKQLQPQLQRRNEEIKAKTKKNVKTQNISLPAEEKLTAEQQSFLNSFEKTLQKSSGLKAPLYDAPTKPLVAEEESVSIHFDQCTQLALLPLFLCNFLGVLCSRSLHYQFYVWYFHSLPHLTWSTDYSLGVRFLLLGLIEFCWNTYPSTNFSSAMLHVCHAILLWGVGCKMFKSTKQSEMVVNNPQELQEKIRQKTSKGNLKNGTKAKMH